MFVNIENYCSRDRKRVHNTKTGDEVQSNTAKNKKYDTLPARWGKYKERFEHLCTAIGVTDDKQKRAMLLTYIGDDAYDIYVNIKPNADPKFGDVIQAFDKHFEPLVNTSYETFLFRKMKQLENETLNQFYIRLREQAIKCDFHDIDLEIKQQIELSTTDNKLRKFSFQNPEKTLQELLPYWQNIRTN